ncbi:MAG: YidH family protein [Planctomycetota bacterium]
MAVVRINLAAPDAFASIETFVVILAAEQPENNWWPAVLFGTGLVVLGLGMMAAHWRSWRRQEHDPEADEVDRRHYANRFRRRMQTSGLIVLVGVMLGAGDVFIWRFGPAASTVFWVFLLLLVCWIALLAVGDMTAIQSHSRNQMADIEARRRVLEQELAEIRQRETASAVDGERPVNGERRRNGERLE